MSFQPVISFSIPYYKGYDYLLQTIESVRAQNFSHWELNICDEGAEEHDLEQRLAAFGDARIHYYKNPTRLGMVGNWNRCLEVSTGQFVTILHSDDLLLPDYAKTMVQKFKEYPDAAALFCLAKIIDAQGVETFSFPDFIKKFLVPGNSADQEIILQGQSGVKALLKGDFIMCPTLCYQKTVVGAQRFSNQWNMVQDLDFKTRLLILGHRVVGVGQRLYAYRRHIENATSTYTKSLLRFREEIRLYNELTLVSRELEWKDAAREGQLKTIILLNLGYCTLKDLVRLRFGEFFTKFKFLWQNFLSPWRAP